MNNSISEEYVDDFNSFTVENATKFVNHSSPSNEQLISGVMK